MTIEVVTEKAILSLRGDQTVTYADSRTEVIAERKAPSDGRTYWGFSHELLIRDFYARLHEDEPFWISPREAEKSLRLVQDIYTQSQLNGSGSGAPT